MSPTLNKCTNSLHSNNLAKPNQVHKEDLYSVLLVEQK